MNELEKNGSADAGSLEDLIEDVPSANGEAPKIKTADSKETPEGFVSKDQYEQLQEKLGTQGNELGKLREYFEDLEPLMEKMRGNEPLIDAIYADKITPEVAQAILEGKVSTEAATKVTQANEEVKQELGKKEYDKRTPEEIEALITKKVEEKFALESKALHAKIDSREEERVFTERIEKFVATTPDYPDYAGDIVKFFEEHPDQSDIVIAYKAVKSDRLQKELEARDGKDAAAYAKELAMNNAGMDSRGKGGPASGGISFEDLVETRVNPNA